MTKTWKPRKKRRYDQESSVVLNQVRLGQAPISLRKSRWLRIGLYGLAALVVTAAAVALWLSWDSRFYIYDAEVVGTRQLSSDEVFRASGLAGLHILWARSGVIESRLLEELPSLESADVSCGLPSECRISVVERQPRVLWHDQGALWWIDEEGAIFAARDGESGLEAVNEGAGQWLVTGPLPRGASGNLDERVRVALTELWASGRDVPMEFSYDPEQGLSFVDRHGWHVVVGRGSGMDERLEALDRLTEYLESRGVTPLVVDVRFPEAPYYSQARD